MDDADNAQHTQEKQLKQSLSRIHRYEGESREDCLYCGAEIPAARRKAVKGARLCTFCQTLEEHRAKHGI